MNNLLPNVCVNKSVNKIINLIYNCQKKKKINLEFSFFLTHILSATKDKIDFEIKNQKKKISTYISNC